MNSVRKTTVSDLLGWLVGIGFVVDAVDRDGFLLRATLRRSFEYILPGHEATARQAAIFANLPRIELIFGVLVIMAVSWMKKTRNEAINDMD